MGVIRVLVVDDSVVIRKLVGDLLAEDPDIDVVGTAVNGRVALAKVEQLRPDVVTMDIEMPDLNGIEAVRALRASGCTTPIIMFSTLTEQGAAATFEALAAGATDYVAKPANVGSVTRSFDQVRSALIPRIKALAAASPVRLTQTPSLSPTPSRTPAAPVATRAVPTASAPVRLLVIGCSTGGPEALSRVLEALPPLPVPVAVVQHMPPVFTAQFAARLDRNLPWEVREARHGDTLRPGTVLIAPGDHHLRLVRRGQELTAALDHGAPENYCRPAVDVLFRSAAAVVGAGTLGVVLTGMGQDGCLGAGDIVRAGGAVLAQDQATSVVWGMPGAVAGAGHAQEILPLTDIAPAVVRRVPRAAAPAVRLTEGSRA